MTAVLTLGSLLAQPSYSLLAYPCCLAPSHYASASPNTGRPGIRERQDND